MHLSSYYDVLSASCLQVCVKEQAVDYYNSCRVWSVAHSQIQANLGMSTSDDGTAKIWSGVNPHQSAGVIQPPSSAPVCDATFCNFDSNLVALASADHNAYVYDLRRMVSALHKLSGHSRPVSFARFLSTHRLVTSSVDGTLACWDLQSDAEDHVVPPWDGNFSGNAHFRGRKLGGSNWRRFVGHKNAKNFVGLAVRPEDGLMACGSETSTVFAYNTHWSAPIAQQDLAASVSTQWVDSIPDESDTASTVMPLRQKQFVSAVDLMSGACQSLQEFQGGPVLAAAMSTGAVKLLSLNQLREQKPLR